MRPSTQNRPGGASGFSLVELIVVVAIIAILMAIAMPSLKNIQLNGERTECVNSLRAVGNGLLLYASVNAGVMPSRLTSAAQTTGNLRVQLPGESFTRGAADSYDWRYGAYRGFSEPIRHPAALGHLVSADIAPINELPTLAHCPSLIDPDGDGHCVDVVGRWGVGGSYWEQYPARRIIGGYSYRGVSYEYWTPRIKPGVSGPPTLQGDAHGNFTLVSDIHDQRFRGYASANNLHGGYVAAFADGGVQWLADEEYSIDALILSATRRTGDGRGSLSGGGAGDGSLDEAIYNRMAEMRQ